VKNMNLTYQICMFNSHLPPTSILISSSEIWSEGSPLVGPTWQKAFYKITLKDINISMELLSYWTLSIIWYSKEQNISETGYVSIHRWKGGRYLGPTERANFKYWTTYASVTTFTYAPEIRFHQWEIKEKFTITVERLTRDLKLR
jgi:hypothetical protein